MKMNTLRFGKALRAALLFLLLNVAGMTKGYSYDFSATSSNGQTLYYKVDK